MTNDPVATDPPGWRILDALETLPASLREALSAGLRDSMPRAPLHPIVRLWHRYIELADGVSDELDDDRLADALARLVEVIDRMPRRHRRAAAEQIRSIASAMPVTASTLEPLVDLLLDGVLGNRTKPERKLGSARS